MYSDSGYSSNTGTAFATVYLVIGLGSIIFFFIGVCALFCCCRQKFRGMERKGYVIRDSDQTAPLMLPSSSSDTIIVAPPGFRFPTQGSSTVQIVSTVPPPSCPQGAPPAYESPPKY